MQAPWTDFSRRRMRWRQVQTNLEGLILHQIPGISEIQALIQWSFPESTRCELPASPALAVRNSGEAARLSEVIGKTATQTVARFLREYAQRTSLRGVNPNRAKAHFTAADSLAALLQPLDRIIPSGTLTEIPGIGYTIADIITKLHQTGSHPSLQKLRKDVPEGVLELFAIPGIRPEQDTQAASGARHLLAYRTRRGCETRSYSKGERPRRFNADENPAEPFHSTQRRNTAPSAQGRGSTSTGAGTEGARLRLHLQY